jgi:hypothetical protein
MYEIKALASPYPDLPETWGMDINRAGAAVGICGGGARRVGLRWNSAGGLPDFAMPDEGQSAFLAINAQGDATGWRLPDVGWISAIVLRHDVVIDLPTQGAATAADINNSGLVCGTIGPALGRGSPFLFDPADGTITDIPADTGPYPPFPSPEVRAPQVPGSTGSAKSWA